MISGRAADDPKFEETRILIILLADDQFGASLTPPFSVLEWFRVSTSLDSNAVVNRLLQDNGDSPGSLDNLEGHRSSLVDPDEPHQLRRPERLSR